MTDFRRPVFRINCIKNECYKFTQYNSVILLPTMRQSIIDKHDERQQQPS